MPNITIYIKVAIWDRILKRYKGDARAAVQDIKQLIEGHYAKTPE